MRQFYYKMWRLLQITLFNLIEGRGGGRGAIPILRENCNPFALFLFIKTSLSNDQIKMFIYSTNPFLLQAPFLPTQLINQVFSWKIKHKHIGVDIMCFFSKCRIFTNKTYFFWNRLMEPVKHRSWSFLQKKVNSFYRKTISAKNSSLDV